MADEKKIEVPKEKPMFKDKSAAGKGDRPRNVSRDYWNNWDKIKGMKKSKYK
jgi:hypothetical protein